jgi:hypothetical protein
MFENRRYLIIPVSIIGEIDFNEVYETSIDTIRKSINGEETFVKYDVSIVEEDIATEFTNPETNEVQVVVTKAGIYGRPSFYSEEYEELTHSEMISLLSTEEWTTPMMDR